MKKKKGGGGGGANWMDTYGDMVTLLLCFFVMLFAMSKVDETKWIALVQSLNPSAIISGLQVEKPADDAAVTPEEITQEEIDQNMSELFEALEGFIEETSLGEDVSIGQGSGYIFISFDDAIFFGGDSYVLLDAGKEILDGLALSIAESSESISEIRVLGHTAQAVADAPNNPTFDRFLSSNRATEVTLYLQQKNIIDPARLVSVGYGQWRPISSNATSLERAKNRRVELIITGLDMTDSTAGDSITQYYTMRESVGETAQAG